MRLYSTPEATFAALAALEGQGKTARVTFVHDRDTGNKLFADKVWYVRGPKGLAAFLLKKSAETWSAKNGGGQVIGFDVARKAQGQASL
jgi:NitT/TauT family transport system substrate-binding protein